MKFSMWRFAVLLMVLPKVVSGQTIAVLESFEEMDSTTVVDYVVPWNANRSEVFIHEKAGDGDALVTDGGKALEIYFPDALSGWAQDFQLILSEDASERLLKAWNSSDPHRYWLFYDITFQSGGGGVGEQSVLDCRGDLWGSSGNEWDMGRTGVGVH